MLLQDAVCGSRRHIVSLFKAKAGLSNAAWRRGFCPHSVPAHTAATLHRPQSIAELISRSERRHGFPVRRRTVCYRPLDRHQGGDYPTSAIGGKRNSCLWAAIGRSRHSFRRFRIGSLAPNSDVRPCSRRSRKPPFVQPALNGSDPTLRSRLNSRQHNHIRSAAIRASRAIATRGCRSDERAHTR